MIRFSHNSGNPKFVIACRREGAKGEVCNQSDASDRRRQGREGTRSPNREQAANVRVEL